jgi:hypothetical protein
MIPLDVRDIRATYQNLLDRGQIIVEVNSFSHLDSTVSTVFSTPIWLLSSCTDQTGYRLS